MLKRTTTDGAIYTESKSKQDNPKAEHNYDLVEILKHRTNDSYRDVYFKVKKDSAGFDQNPVKKRYRPKVLFDTINIGYDDDDSDWNSEYDIEDHSWRVGDHLHLNRHPEGRGRLRSPGPSNRRGSFSPGSPTRDGDMLEFARMLRAARPEYPTTPIITFRGCTMARTHEKWDDLYKMRLYNKENGWRKPVLSNRVILVYISGRMHTWTALDWVLNSFISDGDTVVVTLAIALERLLRQKHKITSSYPNHRGQALTPRMRLRQRNTPEYMKTLTKDIMDYCLEVINPNVIARVCLDLCVGGSREVLQEMYKLYEPNLVCTGSKVNTGVTAPLRAWTSHKITDKLVSTFPLPVIVVTALNMSTFETSLEDIVDNRYGFKRDVLPNEDEAAWDPDASDLESLRLIDLELSVKLDDLYSSYEEISKIYWDYKRNMNKEITRLKKKPRDEEFFANFLRSISDDLAKLCDELRSINPDFKGKGARVARAITGSNSFGTVPYKMKLMLAPEEPVQKVQSLGPSYAETMRALKRNHSEVPKIQVQVSTPPDLEEATPPPKHRDIKFCDLETPPSRNSPTQRDRPHLQLKKLLSHDNNVRSSPKLEPTRSHPTIHAVDSGTVGSTRSSLLDGKKHKRRFWLKIFK